MEQKLPHWLNRANMAASLGISVQAFDKWKVEPAARHGRETFYTVDDVLQNRLAWQERRINQERAKEPVDGPSPAEMDRALLELRNEQAEKLRLENALARKESAPVALIDFVLSNIGGQIAALFEAIPAKLKRLVPKLTASELEIVKRELVKAQNVAAQAKVNWDEYDAADAPGDRPGDSTRAEDA